MQSSSALDEAFHALADRNRRAILGAIRGGRRPVGDIARAVGVSQQVASHHLKVLRRARLVSSTRSGTQQLYAVDVEGLAVGKAFFDDFWPERLARLKAAIENDGTAADG